MLLPPQSQRTFIHTTQPWTIERQRVIVIGPQGDSAFLNEAFSPQSQSGSVANEYADACADAGAHASAYAYACICDMQLQMQLQMQKQNMHMHMHMHLHMHVHIQLQM